jgi:hypothetical protein
MEQIRQVAVACVGRAVLFGSLGIGCVMVGFSFSPVSAFRSGAVLTLVMAVVLLYKASRAASQNPKHTEVWLYLDEGTRPSESHARFVFGMIMREVYARFAQVTLCVAVGMFALSLILMALGLKPYDPAVALNG